LNYSFSTCGGTKLAWTRHNCDYGALTVSALHANRANRRAAIPAAAPLKDLSFEAALKELESIVSRLEQGEVDLEESITLYERGQALKSHCETKLKSAEGRLEKIVLGAGGPSLGAPEAVP
jgi:exodeoxyribonuclease VII small subunit